MENNDILQYFPITMYEYVSQQRIGHVMRVYAKKRISASE